jgi:threonyl-tRNA synthetase
MFNDALGREIQIPTVQIDFATPARFGLSYIDELGEKKVPVMVHRAVLGSYERFIMLILEQFKGVLPIWLSPVQVNIIPINVKYHDEYCKKIFVAGTRAEDMQLRLKYADVPESKISLEPDDRSLIEAFTESNLPVFILPNYTSMLSLRRVLSELSGKSEFWKG